MSKYFSGARVFMKNGKVLQYNDANYATVTNGLIEIQDNKKFFLAKFPIDVVERIDGVSPCKVWQKNNPKRPK